MIANTRNLPARLSVLVAGCLLIVFLSYQQCSYVPRLDANPHDKVVVVGTVPEPMAVELRAIYQTTVVNKLCAPTPTWLDGVSSPRNATVVLHLDSQIGGQATWSAWRDLYRPGECGWQFRGIDYRADRSLSDFESHKGTLVVNSIAAACLKGNVLQLACPENSTMVNDDESVSVHHFCRFSVLRDQRNGVTNACVFEANGKTSPMQAVKHLHILRPDQHTVRFILTDLEN